MTRAPRRVTQADLASRAGVSRSCVSRVLRGLDKVSDDKRERVQEAARELGYIDNGLATALAGNRRSRLVGFFPQEIANGVFSDVYHGLKSVLEPHGHRLVVVEGDFDAGQEDVRLRELVSLAPDCIVVAGYAGSTEALRASVRSIPIVSVTRRIEQDGVVSVDGDDRAGAAIAVGHLVDLGHTRIAHLRLPASIPYEERADGYVAAMQRAGLEPSIITPRAATPDAAYAAVRGIWAQSDHPTAIFCGSDHMAFGVLAALEDEHVSVPGEVSVIGYDDQLVSRAVGLTTVSQHVVEQGRLAGVLTCALLNASAASGDDEPDRPESRRKVPPTLVERRTTGPRRPEDLRSAGVAR